MRALLVAAVLALAACADSRTLGGTVESAHEVQLREIEDHARRYEDPLVPEVGWEIVVRLDDGSAVTVVSSRARRHGPGDRVHLLKGSDGELLL